MHRTVNIPDIKCAKCSLQLLYFMTDKTTKCNIETCTYYPEDSACSGHTDASKGTCFGAPNGEDRRKLIRVSSALLLCGCSMFPTLSNPGIESRDGTIILQRPPSNVAGG